MDVKELTPRMRPAAQFGDVFGEQRLVAGVVVDHQRTLPVAQEGGDMLAGAGRFVVEQDDGWAIGGAVRKEVGALGLARTGIELGYRRFVGMQHGRGQ